MCWVSTIFQFFESQSSICALLQFHLQEYPPIFVSRPSLHSNLDMANSLPNNKTLDQSILKDLADYKINVTYTMNFVLGRVENILEKGENAGSQNVFKRPLCQDR